MSDSVDSALVRIAVERLGLDPAEAEPDRKLADMDLDSLALVELVVCVQEEFDVPVGEDEVTPESTLAGIADIVRSRTARIDR